MIPSLLEALRKVPDHRARNTVHPLASILAMAVCAMLCGATCMLAITQWGEAHGKRVAKALGFSRPYTPCNSLLHYVFRDLDVGAFQKVLSEWLASITPDEALRAIEAVLGKQALAIDGKTLRGAHGPPDTPGVALVAAFLHRSGQVVDQEPVPNGNELHAVRTVLERVPLDNRIVTGDALQTQRDITETILEKGGTTSSRSKGISPRSKLKSKRNSRTPPPSRAR